MHFKSSKGSHTNQSGATRSRKILPTINTNIDCYDRTDPFFAFNVLLKLFGSLPARIGGCQYKLTQEEHKLSLHLLNIVEPFVGLAPSRRSITRQPTETLDAIAFHVESKQDLLSLALSCRRMHSVVVPRHLDYRVIRCKVSRISVWNHLTVHRSLAKNVRRLEILDERSTVAELVPPAILSTDTDLESTDDELGMHAKHERYFVAALARLTALTSFVWSCNHSPICIDNVWHPLLRCSSLREVEINDNLLFSFSADGESTMKSCKPTLLPALATVTLRSTHHTYGSSKQPTLRRISRMLDQCPKLQSLNITYAQPRSSSAPIHPTADELLLYGRWPYLTHLYLTNLRYTIVGADPVMSFLYAHQNLEVLHLDIGSIAHSILRTGLPPNSLPRLRELKSHKNVATAILSCPSDVARPLETIKGVFLGGHVNSQDDRMFLSTLGKFGKHVKRMELAGWSEMEDVKRLAEHVPSLTWLDMGQKAGTMMKDKVGKASMPVINVVEWSNILASFPELTTFHGIRFFYEVSQQAAMPGSATSSNTTMADRSRTKKNDEVASILAWKCPKLRRVDHWEAGSGKVIVLLREKEDNKDKVRWEVRRVKL